MILVQVVVALLQAAAAAAGVKTTVVIISVVKQEAGKVSGIQGSHNQCNTGEHDTSNYWNNLKHAKITCKKSR
jgi:hypothetical protein